MKKLILGLVLASTLVGCTQNVNNKPCIGFMDQPIEGVQYELSFWNIFVGVIFSETIIVPVIVAAKMYQCPAK